MVYLTKVSFVGTYARFLEEDHIEDKKPRSRLIIEELQNECSQNSQERDSTLTVAQETQKELEPAAHNRSGRVIRQPERYGLMSVEGEAFTAVIDETVDDPTSYTQAMGSSDANLWQKAMDAEIGSMDKNSVWTLVDLPEGVKPIGSKWIFKRKRGPRWKRRKLSLWLRATLRRNGLILKKPFLLWLCLNPSEFS